MSLLFRLTYAKTAVSILFVGYLLMQVPSNLMLNKIGRPSLYLPLFMALWGEHLTFCRVEGSDGALQVSFRPQLQHVNPSAASSLVVSSLDLSKPPISQDVYSSFPPGTRAKSWD